VLLGIPDIFSVVQKSANPHIKHPSYNSFLHNAKLFKKTSSISPQPTQSKLHANEVVPANSLQG
jgi:hypothetical protein